MASRSKTPAYPFTCQTQVVGSSSSPQAGPSRWLVANYGHRVDVTGRQAQAQELATDGELGIGMRQQGFSEWVPMSITDCHRIQVASSNLTSYLPDPCGGTYVMDQSSARRGR